ncbi:MAG: hypothetical protein QME45_04305 [Clostridiales bacterium]|nr:hypothetical protein [Clostridiales bacterium]
MSYINTLTDAEQRYNYVIEVSDKLIGDMVNENVVNNALGKIEYKIEGDRISVLPKDRPIHLGINEEILKYVKQFNNAKTIGEQSAAADGLAGLYETIKDPMYKIHALRVSNLMEDEIYNGMIKGRKLAFANFKLAEFNLTDAQKKNLTIIPPYKIRAKALNNALNEANQWLNKYINGRDTPVRGIKLNVLSKGSRAYESGISDIYLPTDTRTKDAIHECGHVIHDANVDINGFVRVFFKKRTQGENLERIYVGKDEFGYRDKFFNHYVGKVYDWEKNNPKGTEVVSMGLAEMFDDPISFYFYDKEHFKLIYAIMEGIY